MILKSIILSVWKQIQKIISFLTSLLIFIGITIVILYLLKIKPYVVTTGSMEPAIPVHSVCFVDENIPLESIEIGEAQREMLITQKMPHLLPKKITSEKQFLCFQK